MDLPPDVAADDAPATDRSQPAPPRPALVGYRAPEPSAAERFVRWVRWFGPGRLAASAVATVVVCAGGFWLLRAPAPPTESSLPLAAGAAPASTMAAGAASPDPAQPATARGVVTVHVAGSVVAPGVYSLEAHDRVADAIRIAGGAAPGGDPDALNLAAPVVDGSRIYVPAVGEQPAAPVDAPALTGGPSTASPLDVNAATAAELDELPGVGPATATAIITERERNGPFLGVDDLERVPGIGPAKLDALRDLVTA